MTLAPGSTFDLREGRDGRCFDFSLSTDRQKVRNDLEKEQPYLVIGSPPCVDFSPLQELNKSKWTPEEIERRRLRGRVHLLFCLEIYADQLRRGAHFLHEHPASATSWREAEVQAFRQDPRVSEVVAHQCRFGQKTWGKEAGEKLLVLKPTRFMSSAPLLLRELDRRCRGGHVHQRLFQSRAAGAAHYPPGLCRAILRGAEKQAQSEGATLPRTVAQAARTGIGLNSLIEEDLKNETPEQITEGGRTVRGHGPSFVRTEGPQSGARRGCSIPQSRSTS